MNFLVLENACGKMLNGSKISLYVINNTVNSLSVKLCVVSSGSMKILIKETTLSIRWQIPTDQNWLGLVVMTSSRGCKRNAW